MPMLIFFILIVAAVFTVIYYYNNLVVKKNLVKQSWSDIDVLLRKRYNLIPNLVNTVKGYATHEQETFEKITEARGRAIDANTVSTQQDAENSLTRSLKSLFAVAERYPELKANQNFIELQAKLNDIEVDIEKARERYNQRVGENNILIESFPGNQVAKWFHFEPADYFRLDDISERTLHHVEF